MSITNGDWVGSSHSDFHLQVNGTWTYIDPTVSVKLTDFGYVAGSPMFVWITDNFSLPLVGYNAAFEAWKEETTRTSVIQAQLVENEAILRPKYRQLFNLFRGNPIVLDSDLLAMHMPKRPSGGHSPEPALMGEPALSFTVLGDGRLKLSFHEKDSEHKGKPAYVHGMEFCSAILDAPPVSYDELTNSAFYTRSPVVLSYDMSLRKKTLYAIGRWENNTGKKSGWSVLYIIQIP